MKALVIYDSYFGNTEKVANMVGSGLGPEEDVRVARVSEAGPELLQGTKLLVVGSPTRAFRPSERIQKFLKGLPDGSLRGVRVAAFDTRIAPEDTSSGFLKLMIKLFGYAAKPIAEALVKKGGQAAAQPEGFLVKDTEGPLKDGELERAVKWAGTLQTGER